MENTKNIATEEIAEEAEPPKTEEIAEEAEPKKPKKYEYFTMLLYLDNPRHLQVIVDIRSGKYPDATAIIHDKDVPDDVKEEKPNKLQKKIAKKAKPCNDMNVTEFFYKKTHVHVVYKAPYQARKSWMETRFPNIETNLIKGVNEPHAIYRYLVHQDDPNKHQYSPNEVFGNTQRFYRYYNNGERLDECEAVCMILDILEEWDWSQGKPSYTKIIRICAERGLYGYLRSGGSLFGNAIRECIEVYKEEHETREMLETQYHLNHACDVIWKLNANLNNANATIKKYQKIVGLGE